MDIKDLEEKLKKVGENLKNELSGLRTNRPSPKLIEDVSLEYMDTRMTVKQLGSITIAPPRDLLVSAWDKNALAAVAKAIEAANLGLSVAVQGMIVRVTLPALSNERRAEIEKLAKKVAEEHRIRVRAARDEEMKNIERAEKEKQISENEKFALKKKAQEAVDKANKDIEAHLAGKVKEIYE
ncbi:MAG: ribosome recycling factor [Candidatus Harrisonbacteria bacterium]|nr:ribosome recycling factor [Candidatus Harrisonbacteria bacterium]